MELYSRTRLEPNDEWFAYLQAFADQGAIAIENARLFEQQQRANQQLMMAYEATIEGWSQALDLRDRETEGHSQRVTQLTLEMAVELGVDRSEIPHYRRGALLHDIGKMGIPDQILLKPGPLTDEEWDVMRQHPELAYNLLSTIEYLLPALNIPYCHHEKWDGSGYPRGLAGVQIPLPARIFAVADVWDALTSDRPYRGAWPRQQALKYIHDQSGRHFDPMVVSVFKRLVGE
ncbi:MAG TPA: HD-GYP domain-containing protein [Anaerolineaceae bacterium]|nr:HD-GYP domain-containing protein [Anaerolineaceae bacterium]